MIRLWRGIRNICRWAPIIWDDADGDWEHLAAVMEYKLWRMAKCLGRGNHNSRSRHSKQCRTAAELIRRIRADRYFENAGYGSHSEWELLPHQRRSQIAMHSVSMAKQDLMYLGKVMQNMTGWWD